MSTWQLYFAYFGATVAGLLAMATVATGMLVAFAFVATRFPRLHFGRPKYPLELCAYENCEILTGKGGKLNEPTGRGRLVKHLEVPWWIGLSSRNRASWFFGLIRTRRSGRGPA